MADKFEKLKELKQLLDEGLIDHEEYSKLKKELLEEDKEEESSLVNDNKNISYCPNCGSSSIQLKTDVRGDKGREINWGRAVAGWVLFGVVGGAVGGLTGQQKNNIVSLDYCYCLNCGTTWKPEDIYQLKNTIKQLTGLNADLSK